jgi:hypothetical protein
MGAAINIENSGCDVTGQPRDLASGVRGILIWWLPTALLIVTAYIGGAWRTFAWPLLLTFMGAACLMNARRCGRLHCFVTGPFFLLLALLSLLYGLGMAPLGEYGWSWLTDALVIGSLVFTCLPEWLFGKYLPRRVSETGNKPTG